MTPNRDPRLAPRRGPRARADDEREQQQEQRDGVGERRRPFQHARRRAEDDSGHDEPEGQPQNLPLPNRGDEGRHVGLARGVQGRQPVQRQQDDRYEQPLIELADAGQHCRG